MKKMATTASGGSSLLAGAGMDGVIRLYDPVTCQELGTLVDDDSPFVFCLQFSMDNLYLAAGSANEYITIWETQTKTKKCVLQGHTCIVKGLSFSPEVGKLASVSSDRTIRIWDYISGTEQTVISNAHDDDINEVCYNPVGTQLATCSHDKTVKVWNAISGVLVYTCSGHMAQ
jgi:WD40 repeat protein